MTINEAFLLLFAMVTGIECALLYLGLHALLNGKLPAYTTATSVVQGRPARLIGVIALLPIPLTLVIGMAITALCASSGKDASDRSFFWMMTTVEGAVVVSCIAAIIVMGRIYRSSPQSRFGGSDRHSALGCTDVGPSPR